MGSKVSIKKKKIAPSVKALEDLIQEHDDLPAMFLYRANNNKDLLEEEKGKIESFQEELLKKHAEVDERTGRIKRDSEKDKTGLTEDVKFKSKEDRESYINIMQEVFDEETNFTLRKIDINKVESVWAAPGLIFAIRWMFEDED